MAQRKTKRVKTKRVKTVQASFVLTRYAHGQHFRSDEEFDSVYRGDTRYSNLSLDGGWSDLHRLIEQVADGAKLGSKIKITVAVK